LSQALNTSSNHCWGYEENCLSADAFGGDAQDCPSDNLKNEFWKYVSCVSVCLCAKIVFGIFYTKPGVGKYTVCKVIFAACGAATHA